jgi:hypothetical protein
MEEKTDLFDSIATIIWFLFLAGCCFGTLYGLVRFVKWAWVD